MTHPLYRYIWNRIWRAEKGRRYLADRIGLSNESERERERGNPGGDGFRRYITKIAKKTDVTECVQAVGNI